MQKFDSVLVANRGEIAVRIIRSAKAQGYRTIAVYSEADEHALHVQFADEAILIGAAPVKDSYLDMHKILNAALKTKALAIHPGYGFLSENTDFSRACSDMGIVFIGPSPEAIDLMGNKAAAKRRMLAANVPCIPGYEAEDQSNEALIAAAHEMGMPIMVKAASGGGGRGMRLVTRFDEFLDSVNSARSEALNAFGSDELILEKAVMKPRHVEIQVFGDEHGNVIHLGERDCSVQRRHQKVIEESPCPVMTAELREAMGDAAVKAAKDINYVGAGTVEFLLDNENNFYFLEMNTRLQVEHPVTEMVTGQDLVAMQFDVAQGKKLSVQQEDVHLFGHAMEARLYAEEPSNEFLPATGRADVWTLPTGDGIRVDHGLSQGQEISPFYDPMLAKIIAWGEDRELARQRLIKALQETNLFGVETNKEFLIDVLSKKSFINGEATTAFIAENYSVDSLTRKPVSLEHHLIAACLLYQKSQQTHQSQALASGNSLYGWRSSQSIDTPYKIQQLEFDTANLLLREGSKAEYEIRHMDKVHTLKVLSNDQPHKLRLSINALQKDVQFSFPNKGEVTVQIEGRQATFTNQLMFTKGDVDTQGSGSVLAPMHGNLLSLSVELGQKVEEGQLLAVMEAMKMEHRLLAQVSGEVSGIYAAVGEQVSAGSLLLEITED